MKFTISGKNIEVTEGLRSTVIDTESLNGIYTRDRNYRDDERGKRTSENRGNDPGQGQYHSVRAGKQ